MPSIQVIDEHGAPNTTGAASGARVCMLAYSFYESDNRTIRYAEALTHRADQVDVVALRAEPRMPRYEVIRGLRVYRLAKDETSKWAFAWRHLRLMVVALWEFVTQQRRDAH